MRSITYIKLFWISIFILISINIPVFAEDLRKGPIDLYLLIDTSTSLASHYNEALSWIRSTIFQEILQKDDYVTLIGAGESVQILSETRFEGPESSQGLEKLLQSIRLQDKHADLAGAIRETKRRDASKSTTNTLGVALMITGTDERGSLFNGGQAKDLEILLKYSKVEDFPGWKLIVIGLNVDGKIKAAAAEYQSFLKTLEQKTP